MKKIKKLIDSLDLIYYEYDASLNQLVLDDKWSKEHILDELIKVTFALSTRKIKFYINEDKSIVLADDNTLVNRILRYFKVINDYINNSRMNIYVLSDKKVKWAKNLPVFEIRYIKQKVDLTNYDALIFTSKNAIYSLDSMDDTWKKKPAFVIAPETAKVLKHLGGNLKFVGKEKHGNEFALELVEKLRDKKVLYIRASNVVSDLVNILKTNEIICDELIVYETICKEFSKKIKLPKKSTIIFSSPSTIKCFFKNINWDESFQAVCIGDTTAKYFPSNITPVIADTTSLESCVKKAIELNS